MSKRSSQLILKFISEVWFGSAEDFFISLPPPERELLLQLLPENKLEALGYYALNRVLLADELKVFHEKFQQQAVAAFKNKLALNQLYQLFQEKKIRFAPVKGTDLAWRCYPSAALRSFCDWDILIHPEDSRRALEELAAAGWKTFDKPDINTTHHHFAVHEKDGFFLEPHRSLSQFDGIDVYDMWQEIKPIHAGSMQHELSAELNIIQLVRHLSRNNYFHQPLMKFLQDAAALISKSAIDWQKVRSLAEKWQQPYPGDVLGIWNDFFPAEIMAQIAPDAEQVVRFRQIFDFKDNIKHAAAGEWAMVSCKKGKAVFIRQALLHMTPTALKQKYHLSSGMFLLLPWVYCWDAAVKICRFCLYVFKPDPNIRRYQQMVDEVEGGHGKK